MRGLFRLALGLLALLIGARLWAIVSGRQGKGTYYLTGARQVRLLFWPLAGLVASLPFVLGIVRRVPDLPPWALACTLVLGVALLSLSVPALVLHARYRALDAETVVLFDPKQHLLEVRRLGQPFRRIHPATVRATWMRPRGGGTFWAAYETLRFDFADGASPLHLSSAVLDLAPLAAWLRHEGTPVTEQRRWLAWV